MSSSLPKMVVFPDNQLSSSVRFQPISSRGMLHQALLFTLLTLGSSFALPDGKVFIVANNQSIIYDVEKNTEVILPDVPNGVRVTNPFDGTAVLLPLSPPHYIPEVLVCGGSATDDRIPSEQLSAQTPASDQCSRITLTPEGIKKGWQVERMLEPRTMPEMIPLPNGKIIMLGGAGTGYAAIASVSDTPGESNADHPVYVTQLAFPLTDQLSTLG